MSKADLVKKMQREVEASATKREAFTPDLGDLAEHLKELRANRGYTQRQVAEAVSINMRSYIRYENGEILFNVPVLCGLCLLYNVSADYLLGLTNYPRKLFDNV